MRKKIRKAYEAKEKLLNKAFCPFPEGKIEMPKYETTLEDEMELVEYNWYKTAQAFNSANNTEDYSQAYQESDVLLDRYLEMKYQLGRTATNGIRANS